MSGAGEEEHKILLKVLQQLTRQIQCLYLCAPVPPKSDKVQPSKCSRILILLPYVPLENVAGNFERPFSQIVLCYRLLLVGSQGLQEIDAYTGRGAKPGSWRDFRSEKKINRNITFQILQDSHRDL